MCWADFQPLAIKPLPANSFTSWMRKHSVSLADDYDLRAAHNKSTKTRVTVRVWEVKMWAQGQLWFQAWVHSKKHTESVWWIDSGVSVTVCACGCLTDDADGGWGVDTTALVAGGAGVKTSVLLSDPLDTQRAVWILQLDPCEGGTGGWGGDGGDLLVTRSQTHIRSLCCVLWL